MDWNLDDVAVTHATIPEPPMGAVLVGAMLGSAGVGVAEGTSPYPRIAFGGNESAAQTCCRYVEMNFLPGARSLG